MNAPIEFWTGLTSFLGCLTIMMVFWLMSVIVKNMYFAFQRPHYVTHHHHYKLNNCTLVEPEDIR